MTEMRVWHLGDPEPIGVREVLCAYGERHWRTENGWRSSNMGYSEPDRSWWTLTSERGPIKEFG